MSSIRTRPFDLKTSSRDFTLKAQVHSRVTEFYDQIRALFSEINGHYSKLFKEKDQLLRHKHISVHREESAVRLRFEKSKERELKECYMMLQMRLQDLLTVYNFVLGQQAEALSKTPTLSKGEVLDKNSTDTSEHTEKDMSVISYDITPESSPRTPRSSRSSHGGGFETPPKSFRSNDAWTPSFNTPNSGRRQAEGCQTRRRSQQVPTSGRSSRSRLSYGGA
jgi:hypothetical protein